MRTVTFVAAAAAAALLAGPRAGAQSLGVGAGSVTQDGAPSSLFLTGNLRIGLLGPLVIEPEAGYWKDDERGPLGAASAEDFSLGANGVLVLPAHPLELYGGVGAGLHFLNRSGGLAGLAARRDETRTALHLLAGLDFTVSETLNLFGAVRQDRFRAEDGAEPPSQTKFYGGLRFKF